MVSNPDATLKASTIPGLLAARCLASPEAAAFFSLSPDQRWQPVSWSQFAQKSRLLAVALIAAGIGKANRVGILAPTSLNWEYAQMGALMSGAMVAGIDPNYPPDQLEQVLRLLDPAVLFVDDHAVLAKIPQDIRDRIKLTMIFEGRPQKADEQSVAEVLSAGEAAASNLAQRLPEPQDAAIMVFSSGTTGSPKAIVFSHEQVLSAVQAILGAFDDIEVGTVLICWLPLANLFQRVINFCAIGRGASSYVLSDPRDLMKHIGSVQPHLLIGVPRVFERMQAGITERIAHLAWPMRYMVQWSLRHSRKCALMKLSGQKPGIAAAIFWRLADKLLLQRLRAAFGTRLRYFVSGSAAMPLWLLEWFEGIGLPVLEAYGVSENIVPIAISRLAARKLGAAGKPLAPNQVSLAPDGEIRVSGPGLFTGYWKATPQTTERVIENGSWSTGDFGQLDDQGFLSLLGRKSECFKTSGGKWISPTRIEEQLRRVAYIEQAVVLRLNSGAVAAILSIAKESFEQRTGEQDEAGKFPRPAVLSPLGSEAIRTDIGTVMEELPPYQFPVGIMVTFEQFSIATGELTTNLKLRRSIVAERFAPQLQRLEDALTAASNGVQVKGSAPGHKPIMILA